MNKQIDDNFDPSLVNVFSLVGATPTFNESYIFLNPFIIVLVNYVLNEYFKGEDIYRFWVSKRLIRILHLCALVPVFFLLYYIHIYSYKLVDTSLDFFLNMVIMVLYNIVVFGVLPYVCFQLTKD
jgi:hypothetical protein